MEETMFIGKSITRVDSIEKVTGTAIYTDDIYLQNMLYGKVKRSAYAHAKILSIDTSKAERMKGVRAVVTAKDLPIGLASLIGVEVRDEPLLCRDRVRYIGDPVAAVAADTIEIAEEAIELIDVKYDELPVLLDLEEAMSQECPVIIHPDAEKYYSESNFVYDKRNPKHLPNISSSYFLERGDVNNAFDEADLIVENKYTTSMVEHCAMETMSSIAAYDHHHSKVTIWTSTQVPYRVKYEILDALGLSESQLRMIVPHLGGGFGGKSQYTSDIGISAALAMKSHRPVKVTFTREEVFLATTTRHPVIIYIKDGVKRNGRIISRQMKIIMDGGAYSQQASGYPRSIGCITNVYKINNLKIEVYRVYTNHMTCAAMRGPLKPQQTFAIESQMDIIAEKLGMDPVEFKLKNVLEEGDVNVLGEKMHSIGAKECLESTAKAIGWTKPIEKEKGNIKKGRGIALAAKPNRIYPTNAVVEVHPDNVIVVKSSGIEMGQGSLTVLSQIAADEFKVPINGIKILQMDSDITPWDPGTTGSRQTFNNGQAIKLACQDAKRQLFEIASEKLGTRSENLITRDRKIFIKESDKNIDFRELWTVGEPSKRAGLFLDHDVGIIGKGMWRPPMGYNNAYTAQAFEVEVDIETGEVKILSFVGSIDCGKAINPKGVEKQLIGGALGMGVPYTLYEKIIIDKNGKVTNPTFLDYKISTFHEVPSANNVKIIIIEKPHKLGPYGAKGIGEAVMIPTPAAIANAIYNAIGVRIKDLPITPEKILEALEERGINPMLVEGGEK